ncbi:MFS transporter [Frankia sp. CNm7]|uniref:MFS transporter n=1 Tax=Frankia nepalensis TaxID=1836974 RepID=A0A937UN50_9ACTN|nr:MFS transporter [Frankia nepalensis]MBL7496584.1 MFS transporter [Frankia nepalensis]MBL7508803.1 MFS transporter [Frankia nepalensis]MBL7520217.1 MFS transporter [Frankia nepalensis]MBL7627557.1 MFS transporter [Frankia nepalensis]
MAMDAYRRVLARPGVRRVLVISSLARVPLTAMSIVLTLRVVLPADEGGLGLGYTAAGVVVALFSVGSAVGAPVVGRGIDRHGMRAALLVTAAGQAVFWSVATVLSFALLAPAAFAGGLVMLPAYTVGRQALAELVPDAERQAALALDAVSVDAAYGLGPLLGVVVTTQASPVAALVMLAAALPLAGVALAAAVAPLSRGASGTGVTGAATSREPPVPIRSWLRPPVAAVLLVAVGSTLTLAGTDVAMTASMRDFGALKLLGLVALLWTLGSLAGGLVYGALRRGVHPLVLLAALAALTAPVALAPSWGWLAALLVPAGLCCAPVLSAGADRLVQVTPPSARGTVLGCYASALSVGNLIGAPLIGAVIDHGAPAHGYVAVGLAGGALALAAFALDPRGLTGRHVAFTSATDTTAEPRVEPASP